MEISKIRKKKNKNLQTKTANKLKLKITFKIESSTSKLIPNLIFRSLKLMVGRGSVCSF